MPEAEMDAIAPSQTTISVLRAIAHAGFAYQPTKELAATARWELVDDELGLGFVRYEMFLTPGQDGRRSLTVLVRDSGEPTCAFIPLFYFEDYEVGREPFDRAFRSLCEQLIGVLGPPLQSGTYSYPHRAEWSYGYAGWALADVTLVLAQDEFDIQFGMDISLWVQPAGTAVKVPVRTL